MYVNVHAVTVGHVKIQTLFGTSMWSIAVARVAVAQHDMRCCCVLIVLLRIVACELEVCTVGQRVDCRCRVFCDDGAACVCGTAVV